MGMFDTVNIPCPECGHEQGIQTKTGSCNLNSFDLDNVPYMEMLGVLENNPYACEECGTTFEVQYKFRTDTSEGWNSQT